MESEVLNKVWIAIREIRASVNKMQVIQLSFSPLAENYIIDEIYKSGLGFHSIVGGRLEKLFGCYCYNKHFINEVVVHAELAHLFPKTRIRIIDIEPYLNYKTKQS